MNSFPVVLIVEDCEDAVPALQIALERSFGCNVQHALDVDSALVTLQQMAAPLLAVITDLNLPGKNGLALIHHLRGSFRWADTPVVVVTADTHADTPGRVRDSGADAFFGKPYSPLAVCDSLEKIIHAKHQKLPVDSAPDHNGRDNPESKPPASPGDRSENNGGDSGTPG